MIVIREIQININLGLVIYRKYMNLVSLIGIIYVYTEHKYMNNYSNITEGW